MSGCICDGRGLVKIGYESGEIHDLALCDCPSGQRLRRRHEAHPAWLPTAFRLDAETRIAWLEDFADGAADVPETPSAVMRGDFLEAGRVGKRARL